MWSVAQRWARENLATVPTADRSKAMVRAGFSPATAWRAIKAFEREE